MPYELPPDPRTERQARIARWAGFAFAAILVALVTYLGYVGFEGSRQLTDPPDPSADCRTPATFGWAYDAINYDLAADQPLAVETDPSNCVARSAPAADQLITPDGVRIAGWYVPAASGIAPTGPTAVLTHGWGSNKSNMLERAALLHTDFNLVLFDLRNHGQSSGEVTTQGVLEAEDLRAVVDWLVSAKNPDRIALLGVSMGGATVIKEADTDDRVDAVVLESTHATLARAAQARLDRAGYPLSLPGSWAILLGGLLRTGQDMSAADPVQAVARLDGRPLLLIDAGADDSIGDEDGADMLAAALAAGTPAELQVCAAAQHARSPDACPEEYAAWVLGFLRATLGQPS